MRHARVAVYDHVSGDYEEMLAQVRRDLVPMLSREPGFRTYELGRDQDGQIVVVNGWDTRAQAQLALARVADWTREHLAGRVRLLSTHLVDVDVAADLQHAHV